MNSCFAASRNCYTQLDWGEVVSKFLLSKSVGAFSNQAPEGITDGYRTETTRFLFQCYQPCTEEHGTHSDRAAPIIKDQIDKISNNWPLEQLPSNQLACHLSTKV